GHEEPARPRVLVGQLPFVQRGLDQLVEIHQTATPAAKTARWNARVASAYSATSPSAVSSQENRAAGPTAPPDRRAARSGRSATFARASAQVTGSWPSTSRPDERSATTTRSPPTSAATTGVPHAWASSATRPNDSLWLGTATTSAAR